MEQHEDTQAPAFSRDAAAKRHGLNERQRAFADARLAGNSKTEAARIAGYSGDGGALRSTASKVSQSPAVRGYMAEVVSGEGPQTASIVDTEENLELLSEVARGEDKAARIRACEAIERIYNVRRAEAPPPLDPIAILARMLVVAARSDEAAATAFVKALADAHGLSWADVQARVPKSEISATPNALTAADKARAAHVERLNTQSLDRAGNGLPRSSEAPVVPFSAPTGGAAAESPAAPPIDNPHGTGRMQIFGE